MNIFCTAGTDVGKERANNEDAFSVVDELGLYVVCDGMGGHQAGEIASTNAVEFIQEHIRGEAESLQRFLAGELAPKHIRKIVREALEQANFKLREMAVSAPELEGMGTTAVVTLVLGAHAFIGHVGDSRIYLFRDGNVHLLTEDHSIGSELQKKTSLPREYRSALTRALGVHDSVEPDVLSFDLFPEDGMLLSTDGLYSYFSLRKLRDMVDELGAGNGEGLLRAFIGGALERGGRDNITGVYLYVDDDGAKRQYQLARKKLDLIRNLTLFRYLTFVELLNLVNIAHAEKIDEGDEVFVEGEQGEKLYIILRGRVSIQKGDIELAQMGESAHFGEMALVDRSPRSATVVALQDTVCLVIKRAEFYDLLRDLPNLAVKVLWSFVKALSSRLRETSEELYVARMLLLDKAGLAPTSDDATAAEPPPAPPETAFLHNPIETPAGSAQDAPPVNDEQEEPVAQDQWPEGKDPEEPKES